MLQGKLSTDLYCLECPKCKKHNQAECRCHNSYLYENIIYEEDIEDETMCPDCKVKFIKQKLKDSFCLSCPKCGACEECNCECINYYDNTINPWWCEECGNEFCPNCDKYEMHWFRTNEVDKDGINKWKFLYCKDCYKKDKRNLSEEEFNYSENSFIKDDE